MPIPARKTTPSRPSVPPVDGRCEWTQGGDAETRRRGDGEGWGEGIEDGETILGATKPAWPPGLTDLHSSAPAVPASPRLRVSASLRLRWLAAAGVAAAVLRPQPAYAMHISDGFLPPVWSGLWFLVAAPFLLWGLWCLGRRRAAEPRTMTLVALVGSAVFVISCLHVPVPLAATCSHACGTGLAAILIGPGATIVVSAVALLFQWLLLGEGGVTTLGANLVSMGVVGALCAAWPASTCFAGFACRCWSPPSPRGRSPIGPCTSPARSSWPVAATAMRRSGAGSRWPWWGTCPRSFRWGSWKAS